MAEHKQSDNISVQDYVPGTIHLVDMLGDLNVQKDDSNIILQPQPTSNVNDPLRWSNRKKFFQFALLWLWAFLLAVSVGFFGPIYSVWMESIPCTIEDLNKVTAMIFLFLGLGCVFLQPTALKLGRRFVYLVCTILVIIALAAGSKATSLSGLFAYSCISGFAAAPVDSLVEISSTDVFFQHQRATAISLLILALYAGQYLGPVACGYINDSKGWRWCFYVQIIIFGALFIGLLFLMEDTTFRRDYDQKDLEDNILHEIKSRDTQHDIEQPSETLKNNFKESVANGDESTQDDAESIDYSIPKRTYWQKIRFMEFEYNDRRSWLCIFYRPFFLITTPAFIWGGLIYGAQMMWLSLISNTQSLVYTPAPYNWAPNTVGLSNLGSFFGAVFGMVYGGLFVDKLAIFMARRNNGILEPEFRVWAMIVPTIFNAAGLLAYGLGSANGVKWPIPVVLGQGLLGFAMSSSGAICLSYAVDSYSKVASEGLVLMLFIRNMIGMGFTFAISPWLERDGFKLTTWLMFMLSLVINGSFILMIIFGKRFRKWSAKRYEIVSNPGYGELFKN